MMADIVHKTGVEKVSEFLRSRNVTEDIIQRFEKEKMDVEAVNVSSEKFLEELGLLAKGDILAIMAFAKKESNVVSSGYEERKQKLIEELRKRKDNRNSCSKTNKKQKINMSNDDLKIKTRKITLGWMHYDSSLKRYKTVRGGGTRKVDMALDSSKNDIIHQAKQLFYPDGISTHGCCEDMQFGLANFQGDQIPDFWNEAGDQAFSLQNYIEKYKLSHVRLYLTSAQLLPVVSDDEDIYLKPMIDFNPTPEGSKSSKRDLGKEWRMKLNDITPSYKDEDEDEDVKIITYAPMQSTSCTITSPPTDSTVSSPIFSQLIGSSLERAALINDQDNAYRCALDEDQKKEMNKREEEEILQRVKERKEVKRATRLARVPKEPVDEPKVKVAVRHVTEGKQTRYFKEDDLLESVYNWVGSISLEPENFRLCLVPGETLSPLEVVKNVGKYIMYMEEAEYDQLETSQDRQYTSETVPEDLLEEENSNESLSQKREEAYDSLCGDLSVTIKRNNIVRDILNLYTTDATRDDLTTKRIVASFEGENAVGSGVTKEMYSLFWDTLLTQYSEGDTEYLVPVSLSLSDEDYVSLGRIITHQFVQFGTFPVRINQASVQHLLLDGVSDDCKISSFLHLHQPKERECLSNALNGVVPFPADEVMEILEEYSGIHKMPSPNNIQEILLQVATNEFINKPYFSLMNVRKGLGLFWNGVTSKQIQSIYAKNQPTIEKVLECLLFSPSNPKEEQIFRWLKRYLKGGDNKLLSLFLRFCTASDVVVPGTKIFVNLVLFPPAALRPKSQTCFGMLTIPRNYESFSQMKNNLDIYIKNPTTWDMED